MHFIMFQLSSLSTKIFIRDVIIKNVARSMYKFSLVYSIYYGEPEYFLRMKIVIIYCRHVSLELETVILNEKRHGGKAP